MRRYLGLDLGTRTCGMAMTDRSNTLILPYKTIRFNHEDYNFLYKELVKIIEENKITDIAIGLPLNMDGSTGFASKRTLNFVPKLENMGVNVVTVDERLTTVEAAGRLHDAGLKEKNFKDKIDMESACIILETYLRSL